MRRTGLGRAGRPRRGVSPIIATILLVAIVVVLAAVLYVLISGLTKSTTASPPLGANLLLASPHENTVGTGHWYNFTVQLAGAGLTYGDLGFQLDNVNGSLAHLNPGSLLSVRDLANHPIASYNWTTGTWSTGALTAVANQQTLAIFTGSQLFTGGRLITIALSGYSGSISTNIL